MNIEIEPEPDNLTGKLMSYENCIFCNCETRFWVVKYNRPCCPLCSVQYTDADILNATYNY